MGSVFCDTVFLQAALVVSVVAVNTVMKTRTLTKTWGCSPRYCVMTCSKPSVGNPSSSSGTHGCIERYDSDDARP